MGGRSPQTSGAVVLPWPATLQGVHRAAQSPPLVGPKVKSLEGETRQAGLLL